MSNGAQRPPDENGDETRRIDGDATHELSAAPSPTPSASGFTPGTMLGSRYRIVAPLGKGGMGEVYRADDTKLGQPVALKFIHGGMSREFLERVYAEVRIGRQVSHPNVCRLYDIVEAEGYTFFAMEYVDGEDLASLLGRIGRLPPDKALEIARDLCGGLAAVHERGIIHRDLKPANVMIDGRGNARLTDFGLAIASEKVTASESAGTPRYMSPEQLFGREVTPRSDLFSMGIILYEMFTGKRFFDAKTMDDLERQHREPKGSKLASAARLIDPAVGRAIAACLEEDPANRPAGARVVLAMLPGGDALEAAVAAGETPSPEMVAAAATVGDLSVGGAWWALLCVFAGLALCAYLGDRSTLLGLAPLPKPPEVLVERARSILARQGRGGAKMESAYSFDVDRLYLEHMSRRLPPGGFAALRDARPGPWQFYYRQSLGPFVPSNRDGVVLRDDPPRDWGMADVELDASGRLMNYTAMPAQFDAAPGPWPEPDWSPLFEEAGLNRAEWTPTPPQWTAPLASDHRAAWQGTYPGGTAMRIEAAAYRGRPVWFATLPPWVGPRAAPAAREQVSASPLSGVSLLLFALALPVGGGVLARRNLRLGRGDRKGALRVAGFVFVVYSLARIFRADHLSAPGDELWLMIKLLAYPALWAIQVWLVYVALEPYARRRWPRVLISWRRLLSGRWRDPLVGRDVLIGIAAGLANVAMHRASWFLAVWIQPAATIPDTFIHGPTMAFGRVAFFNLFVNLFSGTLYALVYLFALVLLRVIFKKDWIAAVVWVVLVESAIAGEGPLIGGLAGTLRGASYLLVFTRCGLLGVTATLFTLYSLIEVPLTLDWGAWYATRSLPVVLTLAGLAIAAFHASLGGKPLLGRLDD